MTSTILKHSILVLPAFINLAAFLANLQTNHLLYPLNLYISNFVHSNLSHLLGNVAGYIVFAYISFIFFRKFGYEREFWISFALIFIFVPVITPFSTIYLLHRYSIGFSGVVSAFIGLYAFVIVVFLIQRYVNSVVSFSFVLLSGVSVITLIYGHYTLGALFALVAVLIALKWVRKLEINRKDLILLILLFSLYLVSLIGIFPHQLVIGKNFINILGHYLGFFMGYMIPWLLRKW